MKGLLVLMLGLSACTDSAALGANGSACTEKSECSSGLCLLQEEYGAATGWTGGVCTASCAGSTCGNGVCVALESSSYCLGACQRASDCRQGYVCDTVVGACLPDCQKGFWCGSKLTCQKDGTCGVNSLTTNPRGTVGCVSNGDCAGSACPTSATKGCLCALDPSTQKTCQLACTLASDCPNGPNGSPLPCLIQGVCAPPPGG